MPQNMGYGKKDYPGVSKIGGHGPIMGLKGLVLQGIMKNMDEREYKGKMAGRPTSMAQGTKTRYPSGGAAPGFERHGRQ